MNNTEQMISVRELTNEVTCDVIDENGQFSRAIPTFKKSFSRKTKEMWSMFEHGDKHTNKDLCDKADEMILLLSHLKNDIRIYSQETGDMENWI